MRGLEGTTMIHSVLVLSGIFTVCNCACVYPSDLIGEWYSTSFGTLNFSNQSFSGFTSDLSSVPLTFTCHESSGSIYVSMTSYNLLSNINVEVYLCMDLQKISSIKYVYTLNNNKDSGTGTRFYSPSTSAGTVTLSEACTYTDTRSPGEYELLIKKDQINNAASNCPEDLQTTFDVTMTTSSVSNCNGTQLTGSNGKLSFNYSPCVTGVFNNGGVLQCMYSHTDGYRYVTLYNNESFTDGSTTFMFTCLTFTKTDATLSATENPSVCHTGQTPTSVVSPGITYIMTDRYYSPSEDNDDRYTVVIIVCSVLGAIIIVIIIGIVLYVKVFRKPRPTTATPRIRKKRSKPSVTEYTPRILGRSMSVEKTDESPCKLGAGEIIAGVCVEKRQSSMSIDNLDAYKPPKKEVWQKKWETDLHPITPRLSKELLKKSNMALPSIDRFSHDNDTSVMELDKAFTMSTSLPESLDYHSAKSSSRQASGQMKQHGSSSAETLNISEIPKYTERSHATSNMPESTGKFGSAACMPSSESVIIPSGDSRLDTITENSLSRENTSVTVSQKDKRLKRLQQNLLRMRDGNVSVLTTPVSASDGTASEWQYKWETVLRPKSGQSDIKRKRRSHSPANLFQNTNLVPKESKWKLLKSKLQNRFGRNKVNNVENLETENLEVDMDTEPSINIANLKIENETVERIKSAESRVSIRTEDESRDDKMETVIRKKSPNKRRRDSLEFLRERMNHLHSRETTPDLHLHSATTTPDLPTSLTNSVNSLNELNVGDGRVSSANSIEKTNEIDKTAEEVRDVKALFLNHKNTTGIIKNTHYDTVSIHTELFYPDEWLYDSCVGMHELWELCSKTTASVRKREYKQYMKYNGDEDSTLKKDKRKRDKHTFKSFDEQRIDGIK